MLCVWVSEWGHSVGRAGLCQEDLGVRWTHVNLSQEKALSLLEDNSSSCLHYTPVETGRSLPVGFRL